jgi:hypothetical protein
MTSARVSRCLLILTIISSGLLVGCGSGGGSDGVRI